MSRKELAQNAFKFKSHEEAMDHEAKVQAKKSHYQRMLDFMELQKRV